MSIIAGLFALVLPGFGMGGMCSWVILGMITIEGCRLLVGSDGKTWLELVLTTSVRVDELMDQIRQHVRGLAFQGALVVLVIEGLAFVVGSFAAISRDMTGPVLPGLVGQITAQSDWLEMLEIVGLKLIQLCVGALASFFWFSGVYWYSIWSGARSPSLTTALGKVCLVGLLGYGVFMWVGTVICMTAIFASGQVVSTSPKFVTVLLSFVSSGLMIVYFLRLRVHAYRRLAVFLRPSLPMSHVMTRKRIESLR